jgi:mxaK protein
MTMPPPQYGNSFWRTGLLSWLLLLLIVAATIVFAIAATRLVLISTQNKAITRLAVGFDVPVALESNPRLLLARAHFLLVRDRIDEARSIVEHIVEAGERDIAAAALYDLANARLRLALDHLERNEIDPAVPQIRLAKDAYRRALGFDPDFWNAKYNYDIAMRLVRDFPQIETLPEDPPPNAKKRPWTDLPGLPQGLP